MFPEMVLQYTIHMNRTIYFMLIVILKMKCKSNGSGLFLTNCTKIVAMGTYLDNDHLKVSQTCIKRLLNRPKNVVFQDMWFLNTGDLQ